MSISVTYIYSACIAISTPDVRIVCDPWFTEAIYDGAWFQFPKVADPLSSIGDADLIYISHVHPDHYDPTFLKAYFARYGVKPVLTADHAPNHLAVKMRVDNIAGKVVATPMQIGSTSVEILPHKTGSNSDIDSALIVKYDEKHCVVNANDIIFDDDMIRKLVAASGDVDILCCGYTGAGPFPQTYFDLDDPKLPAMAERKKQQFFERYRNLTNAVGAKRNLPFAGKYVLGGRLARLNSYRGVADPVEILEFDPYAVVLADNGGAIDTADLKPTAIRRDKYDPQRVAERIEQVSAAEMDYERLISPSEIGQLPLKRLLSAASKRAFARSECETDYHFVIPLGDEVAMLNINKSNPLLSFVAVRGSYPTPYSLIKIDPRYLFGLLTSVYHWNNAEVGSQFEVRRVPNELDRAAQRFLNFLSLT